MKNTNINALVPTRPDVDPSVAVPFVEDSMDRKCSESGRIRTGPAVLESTDARDDGLNWLTFTAPTAGVGDARPST